MSAERVIKEIVTSTPIAQTDDELLSEESGDQLYDERLSKLVREVSRSWPVNTASDDFCTLSDMVIFLTTSAVNDREGGGTEGVFDKYYFRLHSDSNFNEEAGSASYEKDKKTARQNSGISPNDWAERFFNLQDLTSSDDSHLSKERLQILGEQIAEHISGEGKRVTWECMIDFVSFASQDRASSKKTVGNKPRRARARFLAKLRKQFDLTNIEMEFAHVSKKDKTLVTNIVDSKRFHDFVQKRMNWDLTKGEVKEVLREISSKGGRSLTGSNGDVVDENCFRLFLSVVGSNRRSEKDEDNVIVDIVVGANSPDDSYEAVTLCRDDEFEMADVQTSVDLSVSSRTSVFIWVLKRKNIKGVGVDLYNGKISAGTTRLMPIVDVCIETKGVDSALVAAGYTCCTKTETIRFSSNAKATDLDNSSIKFLRAPVDYHRYLWVRRASNHVEARDHAIVDLSARRGKYKDRRDKMHVAPGDKDTWFEIMGRQQHSMKLQMRRGYFQLDDVKLWGNRVESSKWSQLEDRISKCIELKRPGKEMSFMRELETAIRFSLRQKHIRRRGFAQDDLTAAVDVSALFNDHLVGSSTKLNRKGWNMVLKSCGLYVENREADLLFRRLSRDHNVTFFGAEQLGIERSDFTSFVSKTEFELEETAFHLKEELQRRHQLKAANPRMKNRHVERLRSMLLRACTTHDSRRGDDSMAKTASGRIHYDGLSMEHFGVMLRCINEYLTEPEQHRLVLRFDPDFRGSVNVDKFLEFVSSEHDAPRERAERVLLAAQTLTEFVHECRMHGDSKTSQAWNLLVEDRRRRHQLKKSMMSCLGVGNGLDQSLDPDDLSIAVERRAAHTAGIRGALRLSGFESRRLAMLVAPMNKMGKVNAEEFARFFTKPPRPLGEVLNTLSDDKFFGGVLEGYKKWFTSEFNDKQLRLDYQSLRDEKVKFISEQAATAISSSSDPSVPLENFFMVGDQPFDWTSDDNPNGDSPFDSPSEVALVALHFGADDLAETSMFDDETSCYNLRVRTFIDGICRLVIGDIEAVEGQRVGGAEPAVSKMASVCRDLVRDIRRGALDGRRSPSYSLWMRRTLSEFRSSSGDPLATDEEMDAWCPISASKVGDGVPLMKFAEMLSSLDSVFGWNLGNRKIRVWARDWDTDKNDRIRDHEVAAFVDGTSKAFTESSHYFDSDKHLGDAIKFHLGDNAAEALVLKIVKQLKAKETLADAISLLQRAFSHPMVDPYPPKGVVGLGEFRKALSYGGIQVGYDELELGIEYFYESNSGSRNGITMYSGGSKEINYESFIQCVRRAWMLGEASGESTMTGDKTLDTKLEGLRRAIQKMSRDRNARNAPQKAFRKVDSNKDGRITPDEFVEALRNMKVEVKLSREELNRLFAFFDDDFDNTMDYEEFYYFMIHGRIGEQHVGGKGRGRSLAQDADSDSDGDVDFKAAMTSGRGTKTDVFRDIRAAIHRKYTTQAQLEMLKNYIKSKDLNEDGTISEKVFMRFLRKADLLNGISRKSLQNIVNALDPQQTHWINYGLFFRKAMEKGARIVHGDFEETKDYDGLGNLPKERKKKEKAQPILQHILDCAARAHQSGRSFHSCFPDPTGRGAVSRDIAFASLRDGLGCNLTNQEMTLVFDILPERNDFLVEYDEIYQILLTTTPRFGGTPGAGLPYNGARIATTFQPFNTVTAPMTPYPAANTGGVSFAATPYPAAPMNPVGPLNTSVNGSFVSGYGQTMMNNGVPGLALNSSFAGREEHLLEDFLKQVQRLCRDKVMQWGASFSLPKFFQTSADVMQTGFVSVYDFQSVLNRLGIAVSHAELQAVQRRFGQPGGIGSIDYHSFCRSVDRSFDEGGVSNIMDMLASKLAEQRRKGFDIRLSFEMNDSGNTGYVSIEDFRDAVRQLGLPMTESQSVSLAMKFAHGSNHDRVNYNEFLSFMNRSVPFLDLSSSMIDRTRVENSFVDRASFDLGDAFGGGFDGALSPKERAQKRDLYSGMRRFRDTVDAGGSLDFEDPGSVTSKYSAFGTKYAARNAYGDAGVRSPTKDAQRDNSVAVWGAATPLRNRGEVPASTQRTLDAEGKWMCLVCLSENTNGQNNCNVCGALNPKSKSSQIANECPVCHFQNPENAIKCDMCGHQFVGAPRSATRAMSKSNNQTWRTETEDDGLFINDDDSGFFEK